MTEITIDPDYLYQVDQEQVEAEHDHLTAHPQPMSEQRLSQLRLINKWIPPRKLNDASQMQRDM